MPTISDLLRRATIDPREAELLLAYTLDRDRPFILAHKSDAVDTKVAQRFLALLKRRQKHEPIAYLVGSQPFFGREFGVNRRVLIPRPETEVLVGLVKQYIARCSVLGTRYSILDIGTGSGCLAITLALEYPKAKVIASDVSDAVLKIARQNAKRLEADVTFVKDNLLGKKLLSVIPAKAGIQKNNQKQNRMDPRVRKDDNRVVFVANLPYLPASDKKTTMPDVVKFEPSKALFAGRDGTELIVKLLKQIRMLNVECSMFLELDPRQTKKLTALARQLFPKHKVTLERDLCGRERFLIIKPS